MGDSETWSLSVLCFNKNKKKKKREEKCGLQPAVIWPPTGSPSSTASPPTGSPPSTASPPTGSPSPPASTPTKYAKSILLIKDYYQSIKLGAVILQGGVDPLFPRVTTPTLIAPPGLKGAATRWRDGRALLSRDYICTCRCVYNIRTA